MIMRFTGDPLRSETQSGRRVAREAVQGDGFEALASAHSRALAKLSGDIAGAILTEASETEWVSNLGRDLGGR